MDLHAVEILLGDKIGLLIRDRHLSAHAAPLPAS
jgi:hypothetical protein